MDHEYPNEIDWQAFLYLSNEMSESDRLDFELMLAEDQAAREALARQVELTDAVCESYVEPLSPAIVKQHSHAAAWALVASALAVAVFYFVVRADPEPKSLPAEVAEQDIPMSDQLAVAWSQTLEGWSTSDAGIWLSDMGDSLAEPVADESEPSLNNVAALASPSWMKTAVIGLASEMDISELPE